MKILAADIGGTKSWLCLYDVDQEDKTQIQVIYEYNYASADFSCFSLLLSHFLQQKQSIIAGSIDLMCLALPGIIEQGKSSLTNLNWHLSQTQLQQEFLINSVVFINDFQAAAMGVNYLDKEDYITLNAVESKKEGITVVTGAGTGLGLAWMDTTQSPLQLFATEGGHCDFAPVNDQQIALLIFLQQQYAHVSYERILSGAGLVQVYRFIASDDQQTATTESVLMTQIIQQQAMDNKAQWHHQANAAIDLFVQIYAAYLGNLALLYKPEGGIYIAGGIAAHILPWMQGEHFLTYYFNKGRMQHLVQKTALYLVTNSRLGLQGALHFAINTLQGKGSLS